MDLKIIKNTVRNFSNYIPTRYDDITEEIRLEKISKYFKAVKSEEPVKYFRIGDKFGNELNKII